MRFERDISDIGQGIGNVFDDAANAIGEGLCDTYGGRNFRKFAIHLSYG